MDPPSPLIEEILSNLSGLHIASMVFTLSPPVNLCKRSKEFEMFCPFQLQEICRSVSSFYCSNKASRFSLFVAGGKIKYGLYFTLQVLRCALSVADSIFRLFRSANTVKESRAAHFKNVDLLNVNI